MNAPRELSVPARKVLLAPDGQATARLLKRPVLSMTPDLYSLVRWECGEIRAQMTRFGIRHLIVYRAFPPGSTENDDFLVEKSKFLGGPLQEQLACGFDVAVENQSLRILTLR